MPIQGLNFTVRSGFEAHQSYQSTGSFIVYNPNDGVAFVATDRTATGLDWDYKVPSQSGGKFPGPINSYLSIFYLDQSGGGAAGQIVVYASPETVNIPYFWSIGRATQLQSTSLDIVSGPQPAVPGAGIGRLWIDTGGHLNVLQPSGANYVELDSNNYAGYVGGTALGGDLQGQVSNGYIVLRYGSEISQLDSSSIIRNLLLCSGTNTQLWSAQGGWFQWMSQSGGQLAAIDNTGRAYLQGLNSTGSTTLVGDMNISRGNNSGVIYFGNSGGQYLFFDGSNWTLTGGGTLNISPAIIGGNYLQVQSSIQSVAGLYYYQDTSHYTQQNGAIWQCVNMNVLSWGYVAFNGNPGINITWNGTQLQSSEPFYANGFVSPTGYALLVYSTNNSIYWDNSNLCQLSTTGTPPHWRFYGPAAGQWFDWTIETNPDGMATGAVVCLRNGTLNTPSLYATQFIGAGGNGYLGHSNRGGAPTNEVMAVSHFYVPGSIYYGGSLNPISTVREKTNLVAIDQAEALSLILNPGVSSYRYEPLNPPPDNSGDLDPRKIGFTAEELMTVVPEVVTMGDIDQLGIVPVSADYNQLVPVLWSAVRELDKRLKALEPVVP